MLWITDQVIILFAFIRCFIFICFVFSIINQSHTNGKNSNLAFPNTLGLCHKSSPLQKIFRWQRRNFSCFSTEIILRLIWFNLVVKNFDLICYCHFYKVSKRFFLNLRGSPADNVVSIVKIKRFFCTFSVNLHKIFVISTCRMINRNIL